MDDTMEGIETERQQRVAKEVARLVPSMTQIQDLVLEPLQSALLRNDDSGDKHTWEWINHTKARLIRSTDTYESAMCVVRLNESRLLTNMFVPNNNWSAAALRDVIKGLSEEDKKAVKEEHEFRFRLSESDDVGGYKIIDKDPNGWKGECGIANRHMSALIESICSKEGQQVWSTLISIIDEWEYGKISANKVARNDESERERLWEGVAELFETGVANVHYVLTKEGIDVRGVEIRRNTIENKQFLQLTYWVDRSKRIGQWLFRNIEWKGVTGLHNLTAGRKNKDKLNNGTQPKVAIHEGLAVPTMLNCMKVLRDHPDNAQALKYVQAYWRRKGYEGDDYESLLYSPELLDFDTHIGYAGGAGMSEWVRWTRLMDVHHADIAIFPDNDLVGKKSARVIADKIRQKSCLFMFEWPESGAGSEDMGDIFTDTFALTPHIHICSCKPGFNVHQEEEINEEFASRFRYDWNNYFYFYTGGAVRQIEEQQLQQAFPGCKGKTDTLAGLIRVGAKSVDGFAYKPYAPTKKDKRDRNWWNSFTNTREWVFHIKDDRTRVNLFTAMPVRYVEDDEVAVGEKWDNPFWRLFERSVPDPVQRHHMIRFMGTTIWHPERKLRIMMFLYSPTQGIGKSTVPELMGHMLGRTNYASVDLNDAFEGGWNNTITHAKLVNWDEAQNLSVQQYARLKDYIGGEEMELKAKYVKSQLMTICCNFTATANNIDNIRFEQGERRLMFIEFLDTQSDAEQQEVYELSVDFWNWAFYEGHNDIREYQRDLLASMLKDYCDKGLVCAERGVKPWKNGCGVAENEVGYFSANSVAPMKDKKTEIYHRNEDNVDSWIVRHLHEFDEDQQPLAIVARFFTTECKASNPKQERQITEKRICEKAKWEGVAITNRKELNLPGGGRRGFTLFNKAAVAILQQKGIRVERRKGSVFVRIFTGDLAKDAEVRKKVRGLCEAYDATKESYNIMVNKSIRDIGEDRF